MNRTFKSSTLKSRKLKSTILIAILFAVASTVSAQSAPVPDADGRTDQGGVNQAQSRACVDQASEKKLQGHDRRAFIGNCMKEALDAPSVRPDGPPAKTVPTLDADGKAESSIGRNKMQKNDCDTQASERKLRSAERRSFLRQCLREADARSALPSGSAAATPVSSPDADGRVEPDRATAVQSRKCRKEASDKQLRGAEKLRYTDQCIKDAMNAARKSNGKS